MDSSRNNKIPPWSIGSISSTKKPTVAIKGIEDNYGTEGQFSPMRDLKICEPFRLVGTVFEGSADANFWTLSNSGAASAAAIAYIATLTSGTANNGYGNIVSVRKGRFIFANPNLYRALARVTVAVVAANRRRWGPFTVNASAVPQEGFFFEVDGSGVLNVCVVKGGSITRVASGSFNGDVTSVTVDTNVHAYEIVYFMAAAYFYVDNVHIHTIVPTTAPMTTSLTLNACATSMNDAGGTTSGVLEIWASIIIRLGRHVTENKAAHITTNTTTVLKIGPGTLQSIVMNAPTNNTITVYDNTSAAGTVIAVINPGALTDPTPIQYDTPFFIGLTIVTAGSPDLTVLYE